MISNLAAPARAGKKSPSTDRLGVLQYISCGISLALWAWIVGGLSLGLRPLEVTGWLEGGLIISAAVSTLIAWSGRLPFQNVLLAAVIVGWGGAFAQSVNALVSIPFGPLFYTAAAGARLLDLLPWWVPLVWGILLLNSRGAARMILRPWRKTRYYGFWLLALAAVLSLVLAAGLEPFAGRGKGCWVWGPTRLPGLTWYGMPVVGFIGWFTAALVILAFATPAMISKNPNEPPPDYVTTAHWVLLDLLFVAGAAEHQYWMAALFGSGTVLGVVCFALRGARR